MSIYVLYDFGSGGNFIGHQIEKYKNNNSDSSVIITEKNEYTYKNNHNHTNSVDGIANIHYFRFIDFVNSSMLSNNDRCVFINCRENAVKRYTVLLGMFKKENYDDIEKNYTLSYARSLFRELTSGNYSNNNNYVPDNNTKVREYIESHHVPILDVYYEDLFIQQDKSKVAQLLDFLSIEADVDEFLEQFKAYHNTNMQLLINHLTST